MTHTLFSGFSRIASGPLAEISRAALENPGSLVFDTATGQVVDIDPRGLAETAGARGPGGPKPGRPKLGVVAREITLLPRHWDWLAAQPGGASVALRKLVETASRDPKQAWRTARDAAYRFATAIAGDAPGYEEAMRDLYAGRRSDFMAGIEHWPPDIRAQLEKMTSDAFPDQTSET